MNATMSKATASIVLGAIGLATIATMAGAGGAPVLSATPLPAAGSSSATRASMSIFRSFAARAGGPFAATSMATG